VGDAKSEVDDRRDSDLHQITQAGGGAVLQEYTDFREERLVIVQAAKMGPGL
jgi:hypothetical protein